MGAASSQAEWGTRVFRVDCSTTPTSISAVTEPMEAARLRQIAINILSAEVADTKKYQPTETMPHERYCMLPGTGLSDQAPVTQDRVAPAPMPNATMSLDV
jgi:hypothetical protein